MTEDDQQKAAPGTGGDGSAELFNRVRDSLSRLPSSSGTTSASVALSPYQSLQVKIMRAFRRKDLPETELRALYLVLAVSLPHNRWWTPPIGPLKVAQLIYRAHGNVSTAISNAKRWRILEEREKRYALRAPNEWAGIPDNQIAAKGLSHDDVDRLNERLSLFVPQHPDLPGLEAVPTLTDALRATESEQDVAAVMPNSDPHACIQGIHPLFKEHFEDERCSSTYKPSKLKVVERDSLEDFRQRMGALLGPAEPQTMARFPTAFHDGGKWTRRYSDFPAESLAVLHELEGMVREGKRFTGSAAQCAEYLWKEFNGKAR